MAGQIIISNIKTDSDNAFSILANTGAVLFSANLASGITTGIADGSVTNAKLAGSITGDKIATGQITGNLLTANCVSGNNIVSGLALTGNVSVTGNVTVGAGTVANPAISVVGDTNTGIYFPAADTIGFSEGGTAVGQFDSSANFKFNSGYGSVATAYGCRAWVNFNGGGGNFTASYSQSAFAITVTCGFAHGLIQGQSLYITFQSGTASAEAFTVTSVTNANVFVVTSVTSRTTSGNCQIETIIRGSGNVSSITDNGTGDFTVNFTNAMPDANYAVAGAARFDGSAVATAIRYLGITNASGATLSSDMSTTFVRVNVGYSNGNLQDPSVATVIIVR